MPEFCWSWSGFIFYYTSFDGNRKHLDMVKKIKDFEGHIKKTE